MLLGRTLLFCPRFHGCLHGLSGLLLIPLDLLLELLFLFFVANLRCPALLGYVIVFIG